MDTSKESQAGIGVICVLFAACTLGLGGFIALLCYIPELFK